MTSTNDSLLRCDDLAVGYGRAPLVPPLTFEMKPGDVWALVGRNGSGKSTLLNTLLGELSPVSGTLKWAPATRISYVAQRGNIDQAVPARTIDVVEGGLDRKWSFVKPWLAMTMRKTVDEAMALTDTAQLAKEPFAQLSEGQKQRVLIARAMVSNPNVLILDEPTSAMDPTNERGIFSLLDELRQQRDLAILVASHHPQVIPSLAQYAIFLDRDSDVSAAGTIDEVVSTKTFGERYGRLPEGEELVASCCFPPVHQHTDDCQSGVDGQKGGEG